jgi:hypothetical protein
MLVYFYLLILLSFHFLLTLGGEVRGTLSSSIATSLKMVSGLSFLVALALSRFSSVSDTFLLNFVLTSPRQY